MDFQNFTTEEQLTLVNMLQDFNVSVSLADGIGQDEEIKMSASLYLIEHPSHILNDLVSLSNQVRESINKENIAKNYLSIRLKANEILKKLPDDEWDKFMRGLIVWAKMIAKSDNNVTAQEAGLVCDYMSDLGYLNKDFIIAFFLD